jgi:hypothetical protein
MPSETEWRSEVDTFVGAWRRIVTDPRGFLVDMPRAGGLGRPTAFLAICAGANALGHLLTGWGPAAAVWVLAGQVVGAFLAAALFVAIAQSLFDGRAGFEPTFRVVAYAAAPLVVFWVPFVGWLAWLYGAYLMVRGLEAVQRYDVTRAVLTVALGVAALWLVCGARTGGAVWF